MKKFIELGNIFDFYEQTIFGYIVYDVETKEIKYYSYYNKDDIYTPDTLHEYDPFNKDPNYYVNNHDFFGRSIRETISPNLPDEVIEYVKKGIELHRVFNKENNYPTEFLDENEKYLAINYSMDLETFLHRTLTVLTATNYFSLDNSINFRTSKFDWGTIPEDVKKGLWHIAKHEVGHMKVTRYKLDEVNNTLCIKTGFSHNIMDVKPIITDDGGMVYTHGETFINKDIDISCALEEIICDYDSLLASRGDFDGNYPKIGEDLNRLFNGQLLGMRYTASINDLVAYLKDIIPSEDMAYELFNYLYEALNRDVSEKYVEKAKSLINRYEQSAKK